MVEWIGAGEFSAAAGVSVQAARLALGRAVKGHTWRGHVLEVRTVHGRGGRAGLSYEVSLRSLSAALPAPPATAPAERAPVPFRHTVTTRSPAVERRWRMIEPAVDAAPGTPERTAAVAAILAGPNPPAESTLRRTLALYDAHGWAGLADAKRCDAGEARVVVSRTFDAAYRAAGHPEAGLRRIGAELEQLRKDVWASPVRRAGHFEVRRRLEHELGKVAGRFGTPVPDAACRVSRRWTETDRAWSEIDIFKHDAKRFHDSLPHIIRDNLAGLPMDRIVADVKHLDVVLTRPDGSQVWPKVVGFLDQCTGRVFLHPLMLAPGEGVRQEHVIEGFLAMVQAWGFPQGLYLDNGSEFSCFERISHYFALVNETAGKPIIYARAYNAKAKIIEGAFKRLDQYLFKLMPGYTGSDRMNKKTAQVGRPTQPYPGDWSAFCEELAVRLAAFNARPIGGQWKGRSADDVYAEHVANRWKPITVDTLVLDAAFSKRTTRRLDRGGVKLNGVRHWHPAFNTARAGSEVEIAESWRRGADPLFRIAGASDWAYMEPELRFHPQDARGGREASNRVRAHTRAVKARAATVRPYDDVAADRELTARKPAKVLPFKRGQLGGQSRDRDAAGGHAQAAADRAAREAEAALRKRQQDAWDASTEELYAPASTAEPSPVVATSIFSSLQSRMGTVHREGRMGAFAGPPGIGKTTAIASFARAHPHQVARPLLRREGATATAILQAMLAAVRDVLGAKEHHAPAAAWRVENLLENALKRWAWVLEQQRDYMAPAFPMSLVFDEAQTLTPKMIDMLRLWNDGTGTVPGLAIIFVGNDQFRLDADDEGPSFLSAPIASRTGRNRKTWTYEDVTDEDVRRIAELRGVEDPAALDAVAAFCRCSAANRDLRQLGEALDRAFTLAGPDGVTGDLMRQLLPC